MSCSTICTRKLKMQSVFGINMVALVDGQPRATKPEGDARFFHPSSPRGWSRGGLAILLRKARDRGHILEGLAVALANIDEVIALIKASPTSAEAKVKLLARPWKSDSVLEMLGEVGADACRPEGLDLQYGLKRQRIFY